MFAKSAEEVQLLRQLYDMLLEKGTQRRSKVTLFGKSLYFIILIWPSFVDGLSMM